MEVRKIVLALLLLGLAACDNKKQTSDVAAYKSENPECDASKFLKTRFLVQYTDGRVEVVEAENEAVFERDFLEPRLHEINRVEYDALVTLNNPTTYVETISADDWGQTMVHAEVAWNQGIYGQGVKVAVIDTAVDYTHPQLKSRLDFNPTEVGGKVGVDDDGNGFVDDQFGWDFITNSAPQPITDGRVEHGSHVAGIILADPNEGPMSGVAPKATLIPASFIDPENGSIHSAIKAIQYSVSRGARIINASWGGGGCSKILKDAISAAGEQGVLFVAASGNEGIDYDRFPIYSYPAAYNLPTQITVAATDPSDFMTMFSNRSYTLVHIGAPGDAIHSTVPFATNRTGYAKLSGTSMAAPFVSGTAALLWSAKPNATLAQIKQALLSSTDFRSYKVSTQGRLNVEKALTEIRRIVP